MLYYGLLLDILVLSFELEVVMFYLIKLGFKRIFFSVKVEILLGYFDIYSFL